MEHSEITKHSNDLAEWLLARGIATDGAVALFSIAISEIINGTCELPHDRARCLETVIRCLAARTGVNLLTRHRSQDGTDKIVN